MINALLLGLAPVLLFAGLYWFVHLDGSARTPPTNNATLHFDSFRQFFRLRGVLVLLCLCGFLAAVFGGIQARYGTFAAVVCFVAFLTWGMPKPSLTLGLATAERDTQVRDAIIAQYPLAASTKIFMGVLVALDASGNAVNASDTAALRVVGRAEHTVDNSAGSAGDLSINVRRGCFKYKNSATQAIDPDDKGKLAYVEDNETVAETSTNLIVAGRIIEVASDGVWVLTTDIPTAAAVATTVGAVTAAITGGESPTEAEHNALITRINQLRVDVLAIASKINGG